MTLLQTFASLSFAFAAPAPPAASAPVPLGPKPVALSAPAPVKIGVESEAKPCADLLTSPATPAVPTVALTPAEIFKNSRDMIVKLDTRLRGSHAEREHGTAFVVAKDGRLATNYHVVADLIAEPTKYELVAIGVSGEFPAKVLAIDPVNDIAIVKVDHAFAAELSTDLANAPAIGDALFSLGFPKSEEITITSGNFNGEHQMGFAPVMKLSMPLNPGMSGGPCFDRFGSVVGINRAMQIGAQNISYLSPNHQLRELIAKSATVTAPDKIDWKKNILQSVLAQEAKPFPPGEAQKIGKVSFRTPIGGTKCGQDKVDSTASHQEFVLCRGASLALLGSEQSSLEVLTIVSRTESFLRASSPFDALAARYLKAKDARPPAGGRDLASLDKTIGSKAREKCNSRGVKNQAGVPLSVRFCSVEVPQFPGLYNTFVKIEVEEGQGHSTNIAQSFEGMSLETTGKLLRNFVESIHRD